MKRTKPPARRRTKPAKKTSTKAAKSPSHLPNGQFAKGNQIWKLRKFNGREPDYFPDTLYKGCKEYFEWQDSNPWEHEQLAGSYYGEPIRASMHRMVPYTLGSLQLFLGITAATWMNYRNRGGEYLKVCSYAEQVIREQKFQGAAAGYFNHAIIARDLGLVDKKDITSDGEKLENKSVVVLPAKKKV